jgi:ketosteroid isomerase-like protein
MSPAAAATPREVFERVHRLILDSQFSAYGDLFAEDATLELPFAPQGIPRRVEGGEQIRALLRRGADPVRTAGRRWEFHSVVVHETVDPEVIVTEFEVHGEVPGTGQRYRFANLQVLRVRDGLIVSLRDYWNPLDRPDLPAIGGQPAG